MVECRNVCKINHAKDRGSKWLLLKLLVLLLLQVPPQVFSLPTPAIGAAANIADDAAAAMMARQTSQIAAQNLARGRAAAAAKTGSQSLRVGRTLSGKPGIRMNSLDRASSTASTPDAVAANRGLGIFDRAKDNIRAWANDRYIIPASSVGETRKYKVGNMVMDGFGVASSIVAIGAGSYTLLRTNPNPKNVTNIINVNVSGTGGTAVDQANLPPSALNALADYSSQAQRRMQQQQQANAPNVQLQSSSIGGTGDSKASYSQQQDQSSAATVASASSQLFSNRPYGGFLGS